MGVFIMGPEVKEDIRRVRAHAEKPENLYRIGSTPPGDNPAFVLTSGTHKIVFSLTQAPDGILRHLSISTSARGKYPLLMVVWTTAHWFGFTGGVPDEREIVNEPAPGWAIALDQDERCIVVQQPYELHG